MDLHKGSLATEQLVKLAISIIVIITVIRIFMENAEL